MQINTNHQKVSTEGQDNLQNITVHINLCSWNKILLDNRQPSTLSILFSFVHVFLFFRASDIKINCYGSYRFFHGFYFRADGNSATNDLLEYGECCRPDVTGSPYHFKCYDRSVSFSEKPGLFKCKDHYFITRIRTRGCRQLHCIDRITCCRMKTTEGSSVVNSIKPIIFTAMLYLYDARGEY